MDFSKPECDLLNDFAYLASDFKKCDELNLKKFVNQVYNKDDAYGDEDEDTCLERLKEIIYSINNSDKLTLDLDSHIFPHFTMHNLSEDLIDKFFNDYQLSQLILKEGIDFIRIESDLTLYRKKDYSDSSKDTYFANEISVSVIISFSGLKKLIAYLHSQALEKVTDYPEKENYLDKLLDFEKVYKITKENHAKNRKKYLDMISQITKDTKTEDPELKETQINKVKKEDLKQATPVSHQKGMIIIRYTETEYIISKNIEDKLESIMEDLDEFSITHFEEFNSKPCNSTIIVIESIDKKNILKAMKLYK